MAERQLLELFSQRLINLEQNLEIIERGYRQGINAALDVYLTRDTVERERARVAEQRQRLREAIIGLQVFVARYPDGDLDIQIDLPVLDSPIPAGLPSELLTRRPDVQQAWLALLAADAGLAVAHKQRFPRIGLVASTSDVSEQLTDLLNGSTLAWSLLGNVAQPVFNAGRLAAAEAQARARVAQAEERYLDRLFVSFSEVENAISRQTSLADRYRALLESEKSAVAAYSLSFEQYQRGLVTYTTVLESQRRAFDAQTTVLDLRNQLLQNRIGLHLALGGAFAATAP